MRRPVIDSKDGARADLGPVRTQPAWLAAVRTLPFTSLSPDEFEVLGYLLLLREHPSERVFYYGKTGDGGRDILRPQSPRGYELIQCKRYEGNIGIDEIRKELAKLYTNVFREVIPDRPQLVTFYVARDLTAPAKDLLRDQSRWTEAAEGALREHLRREPDPELLAFAQTWWPELGWESEIELTERVKRQPELRDEFFEVKKVVDGSLADVRLVVREELAAVRRVPDGPQGAWEAFFQAAGQEDQAFLYLQDWPDLPPNQRFVAPEELPKIQEALRRERLTFLIGPPAAGKTFTVLQLLWEAYQQGRRALWIAPPTFLATDGPIPAEHGFLDMEQRIRWLDHRLGLRDASDFVSKFLEPDSLIYIEDPFGKRDEEFGYSLHTYKFLDLDWFVEALRDNAARANCSILVTSRTGLFERWLGERRAKGKGRPQSALIQIGSDSYERGDRENFARKLAEARGLGDPEGIAEEIAYRVRFPFEIEKIVRNLPAEAGAEDAENAAKSWWGGLVAAVRRQLHPESDGERLLLIATALEWPRTAFRELYSHMGWPGEPEDVLENALSRLGLITQKPIVYFLPRTSLFDGRDGPSDYLLIASHSSVKEGIKDVLRSDPQWLERLAVALPNRGKRDADLAVLLLSLGIGTTAGPAQDALTTLLFDHKGLSRRYAGEFMRIWPTCDAIFKERMFRYLEDDPEKIVRELAARLEIVEVPAEDAWRLLRLLLKKRYLVAGGQPVMEMIRSHPWRYLTRNIEAAPADLLSGLDELAASDPALFTYALGEVLVERWETVPETFKNAFLSESAMTNVQAQEKVLQAIADCWEEVPQDLRDLFLRQSEQADWRIRIEAASAAWIYHHRDPGLYEPMFMKALADPDVRVPLGVLHGSGEEDHDRRFAEALLDRVDGVESLEMLDRLTEERMDSEPGWKLEVIGACVEKGGDLALGVLARRYFSSDPPKPLPYFALPGPLVHEPESVRLGAIHAYAEGSATRKFLSEEELISLVEGLSSPYRDWALYYLSIHLLHVPESVRLYIESLESSEGEDGEAVREGDKERLSQKRLFLRFPVRGLAEALKDISPGKPL